MGHEHPVRDSDYSFSINPITRAITNDSSNKVMIMQNDHNSERFTFSIPKEIEGHDMSQCDKAQIHYINIASSGDKKNADVYEADDLMIDPENPDYVTCSWLISRNATKLVGTLNFIVRFICITDDKVDYAWNTAIFSGISIGQGIDNSENVVADYSDILETWKTQLEAGMRSELEAAKNEMLAELEAAKALFESELKIINEGVGS